MGRIDGTLGVSGSESNEHQPKRQNGLHAPGARGRAGRKELVGRATRGRIWDRIVLRAKMKTVSICRQATAARSSGSSMLLNASCGLSKPDTSVPP